MVVVVVVIVVECLRCKGDDVAFWHLYAKVTLCRGISQSILLATFGVSTLSCYVVGFVHLCSVCVKDAVRQRWSFALDVSNVLLSDTNNASFSL